MWARTPMVTLTIQLLHFWLKTLLVSIVFFLFWPILFPLICVCHSWNLSFIDFVIILNCGLIVYFAILLNTEKKVKYFTYYYMFYENTKKSSQEMLKALPHGGYRFEILMAQLSQPWNRSMAPCQTELHNVDWGQVWQDLWGPSDFVTAYLLKVFNQKVLPWKLLPFWTQVLFITVNLIYQCYIAALALPSVLSVAYIIPSSDLETINLSLSLSGTNYIFLQGIIKPTESSEPV